MFFFLAKFSTRRPHFLPFFPMFRYIFVYIYPFNRPYKDQLLYQSTSNKEKIKKKVLCARLFSKSCLPIILIFLGWLFYLHMHTYIHRACYSSHPFWWSSSLGFLQIPQSIEPLGAPSRSIAASFSRRSHHGLNSCTTTISLNGRAICS